MLDKRQNMDRTEHDGNAWPPLPVSPPVIRQLTSEELAELCRAKRLLENPGLTARMANVVGRPLEKGMEMLPAGAARVVQRATRLALFKALQLAVVSLGANRSGPASERFHKVIVGVSGGIGGAFGLVSLPIELPFSTMMMLRSIADIARSERHDLRDLEVKFSCLEVFALGGRSREDDAVESSYWVVRAALAEAISEAVAYLANRGVVKQTAPAVLRLIAAIASRFGLMVTEQVAAKAIPIVGAAGGSMVNVLFLNHFQDMARGHFIVKRLERRYGSAMIREIYHSIAMPDRSR
jgi:EcsC protein family